MTYPRLAVSWNELDDGEWHVAHAFVPPGSTSIEGYMWFTLDRVLAKRFRRECVNQRHIKHALRRRARRAARRERRAR